MKHCLSIEDLGGDGITALHELTDRFVEVSERRIPKVPALLGKTEGAVKLLQVRALQAMRRRMAP